MNLNLRQMAEIAAIVSAKSTLLIESPTLISDESLQTYWQCTRGRSIDWVRRIDDGYSRLGTHSEAKHPTIWQSLRPVLSEIFVTEILTRVWGATLTALDRHRGLCSASPIASHTTDAHTDVRNRAMRLMVSGPRVPLNEVAQIDRIRRRAERWTDLLVGHLALKYDLEQFAFVSRRSLEFGQSQMQQIVEASDEPVWEFALAGVRLGFSALQSVQSPSDNWNRSIVESIIGSFPPDCFAASGLFQTVPLSRIERSGMAPEKPPLESGRTNSPETPVASRLQFAKLKQRFEQN